MPALLDKLKKTSKLKYTEVMGESKIIGNVDSIPTMVPALNIALSGSLKGGLSAGITMFAGESKMFKTMYCLLCAKAYLDKYDDGVLVFYDSEMGASKDYFQSLNIDMNRVLHCPITDVEMLKFDITSQLENIERGDHVIIVIDSIGNLASRKEVNDALEEKTAADMTRAKQLKSLTRIITAHVALKNIPLIMVNHSYQDMGLFPKEIVSGGRGLVYAANQIFLITRSQEKKGTDIVGWNFNINVMKSRFVREKSKIPVTVMNESGIVLSSGLLDMAMAAGIIVKPSNGWYQYVDEDGVVGDKMRASAFLDMEFWKPVLKRKDFNEWIENTFKVTSNKLIRGEEDLVKPNEEFTTTLSIEDTVKEPKGE